jgi:uncharacterized membrane protein
MNRGLPLRFRHYWDKLEATLWFTPALIGAIGCGMAVALLFLDATRSYSDGLLWMLYTGDPASARDLIAALLSGMITMASLAISITMVVLTLAAAQLGPRLVSNFIRDRGTQLVLGFFIATILYLLVVLRTLNESVEGLAVPHFSITTGSALVALSLFVLLFYVHKLARSTNADTVINAVATDLYRRVEKTLPRNGEGESARQPPAPCRRSVSLGQTGYVQTIDVEQLVRSAAAADVTLHVDVRPGQFVLAADRLIAVVPPESCGDELVSSIRAAVLVGPERTPTQDVEYEIRQLVEIALRALSPGINDPFSAIAVIDHLSGALALALGGSLERAVHSDDCGKPRVVRNVVGHGELIAVAFDQIRVAAAGKPAILLGLIRALERLGSHATADSQRHSLRKHAAKIWHAANSSVADPDDRNQIEQRYRELRYRLNAAIQ